MTIEIKDYGQLIALSKVLGFVKYHSKEYDCKEFACSPYIGDFYQKVMNQLEPYYQQHIPEYSFNNIYIEENVDYLLTIKKYIEFIENWNNLALDTIHDTIQTMIFPLKYQEETLNRLIDFGNDFHKKGK
jgi:hypothetical protein